jgi:hypothetical protein
VDVNFQQTTQMLKASAAIKYAFKFKKKNKGVDIRLFAGTFIDDTNAGLYRFRLSGQRGYQDYLYDHTYLGRMETKGILANQFTETDGGFKFYSAIGQTAKSIAALNIKSSLGNLKLPLCLYADIGMTSEDGRLKEKVLYNAGVCLSLRKDVFEIYFPLLISNDFNTYKKTNDLSYEETIRFTLNLNLINPFDLIRNFSF